MAGSRPGGDRRREVNIHLNLVPFIDLLSTTILFLLLTVVWVEISKMAAFSQSGGETTVTHSDVSNINEANEKRDWDVIITRNGVEIVQNGRAIGNFQTETAIDEVTRLSARLNNPQSAKINVRAADNVIYEDVITVLDALFTAELFNVSIGGVN